MNLNISYFLIIKVEMEEFSWQTEFKEFTNEDANFGKKIRSEFIVKKLKINEDKGDS